MPVLKMLARHEPLCPVNFQGKKHCPTSSQQQLHQPEYVAKPRTVFSQSARQPSSHACDSSELHYNFPISLTASQTFLPFQRKFSSLTPTHNLVNCIAQCMRVPWYEHTSMKPSGSPLFEVTSPSPPPSFDPGTSIVCRLIH